MSSLSIYNAIHYNRCISYWNIKFFCNNRNFWSKTFLVFILCCMFLWTSCRTPYNWLWVPDIVFFIDSIEMLPLLKTLCFFSNENKLLVYSSAPRRPLDVAILVDWSNSFRNEHWQYIVNYLRRFIERLGVSADRAKGTWVSFIGYSSTANVVFNFNGGQNLDQIRNQINSLQRQAGYRNPDVALRLARSNIFTAAGGSRNNARKVKTCYIFMFLFESCDY